jgi:hypothetical protein
VPGNVFGALADFRYHYGACSILEAAYTCPKDKVKHCICEWVTPADVEKAKKKDGWTLAEAVLSKARLLFGTTGLKGAGEDALLQIARDNKLTAVFAKLDINMGRYMMDKQGGSKQAFSGQTAIARRFIADLVEAFPKATVQAYKEEWPEPEVSSLGAASGNNTQVASSLAAKPNLALYEVNAAGHVVDPLALLRHNGLDLGADVAVGEKAPIWQISMTALDDEGAWVTLQRVGEHSEQMDKNGRIWASFSRIGPKPIEERSSRHILVGLTTARW